MALGYPPSYASTLSKVLRGTRSAITLDGENTLRERLGLPRVGRLVLPRPGERVVAKKQRRPSTDLWRFRQAAEQLSQRCRQLSGTRVYNRKGHIVEATP